MVEQGLKVTFNPNGCFLEDMKNQGRQIDCKREKDWTNVHLTCEHEMNSMLFTHGKGVEDIRLWHKWDGHVNLQHFKLMEKQNLVGLPKFGTKEVMPKVCETF